MGTKIIKQDGKVYKFNPGDEGNLTVIGKTRDKEVDIRSRAKVIPILREMRKKPVTIGSSRG